MAQIIAAKVMEALNLVHRPAYEKYMFDVQEAALKKGIVVDVLGLCPIFKTNTTIPDEIGIWFYMMRGFRVVMPVFNPCVDKVETFIENVEEQFSQSSEFDFLRDKK